MSWEAESRKSNGAGQEIGLHEETHVGGSQYQILGNFTQVKALTSPSFML